MLTNEEAASLGTAVFRSDYARARSRDGQGLGLISNRRLAERWKMRIVHRQAPPKSDSDVNVWHVFGLEIPRDLIFEDGGS
jgi:signal transduction histidine kinase